MNDEVRHVEVSRDGDCIEIFSVQVLSRVPYPLTGNDVYSSVAYRGASVWLWGDKVVVSLDYEEKKFSGIEYLEARTEMTRDEYREKFYLAEDLEKLSRPCPTKEDM